MPKEVAIEKEEEDKYEFTDKVKKSISFHFQKIKKAGYRRPIGMKINNVQNSVKLTRVLPHPELQKMAVPTATKEGRKEHTDLRGEEFLDQILCYRP